MNYKLDLGKDSILKIFIQYAVPSALGMLAMSLAGIVDGIFIGRYVGTNGLAAINLVYPLAALALGISIMIGVGGSTVATTELGAEKIKTAQNTFTVTIILITSFALFVVLAGSLFMDNLIGLLGSDNLLKNDVKDYLSTIILFFPFLMLTFILDAFIRSDGSPLFSVVSLIISALINIVLDYYFVAEFSWGLKGAAMATGISQTAAFIMLSLYILKGKTEYRFVRPVFNAKKIKLMLFNGSSELVNEMSAGFSTYIFNLILMARLGAIGVAAYSVVGYGAMVGMMIFFGVAQAIQPGVSYNLGAENLARIKAFLKLGTAVNIAAGTIMFLLMFFFAEPLASIFAKDNLKLIELTVHISKLFSFSFLLSGINIVLSMFFTSMHRAKDSIIIALSRSLIFILVGLAFLPLILGDNGIWLAIVFAELITLMVSLFLFKKKPLDESNIHFVGKSLKQVS